MSDPEPMRLTEIFRMAARYQWLTQHFELATGPRAWAYHHFVFPRDADEMSAAIDAAIKEEEARQAALRG